MRNIVTSLSLLLPALLLHLSVFGGHVGDERASTVAKHFYFQHFGNESGLKVREIVPSLMLTATDGQEEFYHIFNIGDAGYVIVSAWDGVHPVLAAGNRGKYAPDEVSLPPAMEEMLDGYTRQISYAIRHQLEANDEIAAEWEKWMEGPQAASPSRSVSPLITSAWNQSCYYNALCPYDNNAPSGYCDHVPVGCVAISMGQIMNYYEYPATGTGSHTYYANPYGMQSADFGNTTYNWSSMPNQLYGHNTAVATLLYHCGVSVEMQYGPDGSGAYTSDARNALVTYFNYSNTASYVYKNSYSNTVWEQMLRAELDEGRPVIYRGQGSGGHAWVCDGYTSSNYFHMNWGWGGYYDAYFYLSDLTPGNMNFTIDQAMIKGIYPAQVMAQQIIPLDAGWNSVSSMLIPLDTDPEEIFGDISAEMVIMQNLSGVYYPAMGINTLGNWDQHSGYLIKVSDNCTLDLSGFEIQDRTLTLNNGWNLIPVLSDCPVDTEELFEPIQNYIRIVKDAAGTGIYWPAQEVNTLPVLEPGESYYVKIFSNHSITFPVCPSRSE